MVANYDVDRQEDLDKANQALKAAVDDLMAQEEIRGLIIGEPSFAGLVGLSNTAFTLRVSFTTLPLKQWAVRFALDTREAAFRSRRRACAGTNRHCRRRAT